MLSSRSLFFCRADKLGDPFEGYISNREERELYNDMFIAYNKSAPDKAREYAAKYVKTLRDFKLNYYINCWHSAKKQTLEMWKIYAAGNSGIAIETDTSLFAKSITSRQFLVSIGRVKYTDFTQIDYHNLPHYPFMRKGKSYIFEKEVRAFTSIGKGKHNIFRIRREWEIDDMPKGVYVKIKPEVLIKNIYVSPASDQWFRSAVYQVSKKFGISVKIKRSTLLDPPRRHDHFG